MLGSSPLARGTRHRRADTITRSRLIPARAGNTHQWSPDLPVQSAHPRSRGEHVMVFTIKSRIPGSSPLARGTRHHSGQYRGHARLIPARAGNTVWSLGCLIIAAAHPRSRGEHTCAQLRKNHACGSSPLARGTHARVPQMLHPTRLIPARAGNTHRPSSSRKLRTAHPRSRGEHFTNLDAQASAHGSSPLARGTPSRAVWRLGCVRLIPARAGNTAPPVRG